MGAQKDVVRYLSYLQDPFNQLFPFMPRCLGKITKAGPWLHLGTKEGDMRPPWTP